MVGSCQISFVSSYQIILLQRMGHTPPAKINAKTNASSYLRKSHIGLGLKLLSDYKT